MRNAEEYRLQEITGERIPRFPFDHHSHLSTFNFSSPIVVSSLQRDPFGGLTNGSSAAARGHRDEEEVAERG